jgi:quinoprotein dehydrogenase-associated probable ABC transporter substrate-binding protein
MLTDDKRYVICLILVILCTIFAAQCSQNVSEETLPEAAPPQPQYSSEALRVCADPNNLPFSNEKQEGFENKIADILAEELEVPVEYTWWAQRRGFIRNTLRDGKCDVVIGVPNSFELALTSRPYYRSTYVFVYRKDKKFDIRSFDDEILKTARVGVHLIGDDYANSPPVHALNKRGIRENIVGFTVYGDYTEDSPPSKIIRAVAKGEIDVAIAWGPMAGYFAGREKTPLEIIPVSPQIDLPYLPMVYEISLGVRRGEEVFLNKLEKALDHRKDEIQKILNEFGVPDAETQTASH